MIWIHPEENKLKLEIKNIQNIGVEIFTSLTKVRAAQEAKLHCGFWRVLKLDQAAEKDQTSSSSVGRKRCAVHMSLVLRLVTGLRLLVAFQRLLLCPKSQLFESHSLGNSWSPQYLLGKCLQKALTQGSHFDPFTHQVVAPNSPR